MKTCSRCREEKPLDAFPLCRTHSKDGRQPYCRSCKAAYAKEWYWRNHERAKKQGREWMRGLAQRDPGYSARANRRLRVANPEKFRAQDAERRKDPARRAWQAAYWKKWKEANPEKTRLISKRGEQNRRARLAEAFVESVDHAVVFARDGGICGICSHPVDPQNWHLDHIIQIFHGGKHSYSNVRVTHPSCNLTRPRKLVVEEAA